MLVSAFVLHVCLGAWWRWSSRRTFTDTLAGGYLGLVTLMFGYPRMVVSLYGWPTCLHLQLARLVTQPRLLPIVHLMPSHADAQPPSMMSMFRRIRMLHSSWVLGGLEATEAIGCAYNYVLTCTVMTTVSRPHERWTGTPPSNARREQYVVVVLAQLTPIEREMRTTDGGDYAPSSNARLKREAEVVTGTAPLNARRERRWRWRRP